MSNDDVNSSHDCRQIAEYATVPNVMMLSQQPRVCLTESEEVPQDWTQLFVTKCKRLFKIVIV